MSILFVYHVSSPEQPNKVLTHFEDIASTLAEQGVGFDRLQAATPMKPGVSHEEVISAYREQIDGLMTQRGHVTFDVLSVNRDDPQKAESRARFVDEHQHAADEVRFFVAGRGLFTLHIGDFIYAVQCEKNDLISVPAGTGRWFDMGEHPHLVAIRLFNKPEGAIAHFTGDDIAGRFPQLED
jgi:1,2-dihydroxy-3-keto-5-methylthiopentene dioxygenase